MKESLFITYTTSPNTDIPTIQLSPSKSESNRALIIQALSKKNSILHNLSDARDTKTLSRLLQENNKLMNVLDAGTAMRFLTAYLSIHGESHILTGTERMQQRPIKILVEALKSIGTSIEYLNNEGFPPIKISRLQEQQKHRISINGSVSSQYISALLMIAPRLPKGLELEILGNISSKPYIEMTLQLMHIFGIQYTFETNIIKIPHQEYLSNEYTIEADWSGASYWFSTIALSQNKKLKLLGLRKNSYQGDSYIREIMEGLGVKSTFRGNDLYLEKYQTKSELTLDFTSYPDLAQTVIVCASCLGITLFISGLESLKIKETDRITALQKELIKFGSRLEETETGKWVLTPPQKKNTYPIIHIETYEDHRMAMAFAPVAQITPLEIENPNVVIKSYPNFWEECKKYGFICNRKMYNS
ncbi:MAG: hypothetical protein QM536_01655 [Chitinophagaceae bacterium]|nr:hypothetical protein [Chitinophagaceae bacterium]